MVRNGYKNFKLLSEIIHLFICYKLFYELSKLGSLSYENVPELHEEAPELVKMRTPLKNYTTI